MRKWRWNYRFFLLLVLLFMTFNIGVFATIIEENTINEADKKLYNNLIIVDKNNHNHFNSIQEAIDYAPDDSTIYIKNGHFSEIININKKLNIIGESKEKTIINPISKKNGYAIKISSEDIKINNISIQNKGPGLYTTGIKINAKKTTIISCKIYDTPVGIAIWSSENKIQDCTFYNCSDEGIALLGSEIKPINANEITNCDFYNNCDGIELQYSSDNKISSCRFSNNSHAGIDAISTSNNNNIIINCNFEDNNAFGIFFSKSKNNIISQCKMIRDRIMTTASNNIKLEKCEIDGIYLTDNSSMTLTNCSNVIKSKIKTIDSNYNIININLLQKSFLNLKEKREIFFSKLYSIISLLNL